MPISEKKREYIREYKKRKYDEDIQRERCYQSSIKLKKKYDVSPDVWNKYKHHLIDAFNLSKIIQRFPVELLEELLREPLILNLKENIECDCEDNQ